MAALLPGATNAPVEATDPKQEVKAVAAKELQADLAPTPMNNASKFQFPTDSVKGHMKTIEEGKAEPEKTESQQGDYQLSGLLKCDFTEQMCLFVLIFLLHCTAHHHLLTVNSEIMVNVFLCKH